MNNTPNARVLKTNRIKQRNGIKLKTPTNKRAQRIAFIKGIWRFILVPDSI
jgi:hypothetical protein